jgi:hypothetical protein
VRTSKNAAAAPTTHDAICDPSVRPTAQEKPWVWRTCARRDRRPCGERTTTPRPSVGGSAGGGAEATQAEAPGTRWLAAPAVGQPRIPNTGMRRYTGIESFRPNLSLTSSYKLSSNTSYSGVGCYAPAARTTLNPCVFLCSSHFSNQQAKHLGPSSS